MKEDLGKLVLPMLYLIGGAVIALIGSGRYSLEGRREDGF